MKSKKFWISAVILVLFALVAGVVYAGSVNGVEWYYENSRTVVRNNNSYEVYVTPILTNGVQYDEFRLYGREHTYVNGEVKSLKIRY
jgi:hypothetical protein